ncbi:hypothetical protein RRG08_006938 [Elysia crispata]|uniref:Uncharacterized protein n=1 Tax=Elysia crispata TaxID=231223 RepID=A0AAE0YYR1_9GAST|nr:hypothetical protein RRG08_006938 [Elysia crispata]
MSEMECVDDNQRTPSLPNPELNPLWMKLAVAVAVIRSKPPGKTGKEHAESLRSQYFLSQAKLHERLTNKNFSAEPNTRTEFVCTDNQMTPPSSSDFEAASSTLVYSHHLNNLELDQSIMENTKFTRSLIALQDLSRQNFRRHDTPVLHAAVANLHSLCGVLERDMVCLSESCLSQAALTITLIMAKFPSLEEMEEQIQHGIEADFMKEVCNFVQLVVDMLTMQPTDFGQYPAHRQKHSLVRMLLVFIEHGTPSLASSIVEQLTESLEEFCKSLNQAQNPGKLINPDLYENSYFTIQTIELTLDLWRRGCPVHPAFLQELQTKLDACLQGITERFPLVAQAVWRLTSLVEAILQNR